MGVSASLLYQYNFNVYYVICLATVFHVIALHCYTLYLIEYYECTDKCCTCIMMYGSIVLQLTTVSQLR